MKFHSDVSKGSYQNKLLNDLGSFWLNHLEDPDQARGLVSAAHKTQLMSALENALKGLINDSNIKLTDFFVEFDGLNIVQAQISENLESFVYINNTEKNRIKKNTKKNTA